MPASLSRHARHARSAANKAANRLVREEGAYQMALNLIHQQWHHREAELGRELLPDEIEELCDRLTFDDMVAFIRSPTCCK